MGGTGTEACPYGKQFDVRDAFPDEGFFNNPPGARNLVYDLPLPVGLPAGGAVGVMLLAAYDHRLLELPAVLVAFVL